MDRTGSVRVVVHAPQRIRVKPGSYTGSPVGDLPIDHNGVFNCKPFATATVNVPQPSGSAPDIVENGEYNIKDYETVKVALPFETPDPIAPETSRQTIVPREGYEALEQVVIKGISEVEDPAFIPENIREGVNLFGKIGTMEAKPIEIVPKDVNFYGLYGELVYSYTADEFLALDELPALPEYEGFTAQNWNWDYEHLRQEVLTCGEWECGSIHIPSNHKTEIEMVFENDLFLSLVLHLFADTDAYVDWGDGSELSFVRGWGNMDVSHEYHPTSYPARYTISYWSINPEEYRLIRFRPFDQPFQSFIKKLWLACDQVEFTFGDMVGLKILTMPQETTLYRTGAMSALPYLCFPSNLRELGSYTGYRMSSIKKVLFSQSIEALADFCCCQMGAQKSLYLANIPTIGDRPFYESFGFEKIVIDNTPLSVLDGFEKRLLKEIKLFNISEIPAYALQDASFLTTIKIPNTVRSIGDYALNASNLLEIDMSDYTDPSKIPTLAATTSLNENVKRIKVFDSAMQDAFISAINWSYFSSKIQVDG